MYFSLTNTLPFF
jgi:RNase H-like domain found in reverse transcriptase